MLLQPRPPASPSTSSFSLILASSVFKSASAAGMPSRQLGHHALLLTASSADGSFFASMLVFSGCVPFEPSR